MITEPLRPKLIEFEFERVKADKLLLVVPAERLTLESNPAVEGTEYEAITDPALLLKVNPLLLAKLRVWKVELPPLAENAWLL